MRSRSKVVYVAIAIVAATACEGIGSRRSELSTGNSVPPGQLESVGRAAGCTATLIHPQLVVSAAHCFCQGNASTCSDGTTFTLEDVFPVDDPLTPQDESATRTSVSSTARVSAHPEFGSAKWLYRDAAILLLDRPIGALAKNVEPMPLANRGEAPVIGDSMTLVGFGGTGAGCSMPSQGKWSLELEVTGVGEDVTFDHGGSHVCPGDSGGPALADGQISGVASWGNLTDYSNYQGLWVDPEWLALGLGTVRTPLRTQSGKTFVLTRDGRLAEAGEQWLDHGKPTFSRLQHSPGPWFPGKVFVVGPQGSLFERWFESGTDLWVAHGQPAGRSIVQPAAGAAHKVFAVADDGSLWERYWSGQWTWTTHGKPPGSKLISAPAVWGEAFAVASLTDSQELALLHWSGSSWVWSVYSLPFPVKNLRPLIMPSDQGILVVSRAGALWHASLQSVTSNGAPVFNWTEYPHPVDGLEVRAAPSAPQITNFEELLFVPMNDGSLWEFKIVESPEWRAGPQWTNAFLPSETSASSVSTGPTDGGFSVILSSGELLEWTSSGPALRGNPSGRPLL